MNIIQIFKKFPTQESCIEYLEQKRWGDTPICSYCESTNTYKAKDRLRHHCNSCRKSFSVTIKTIFHDTRLPLQKWFLALCLVLNARKGISSCQLGRDIEVRQPTAWSMMRRIRNAMKDNGGLLTGIVEMDETYIGGKPRKKNKSDDDDFTPPKRGRGTDKECVVGMIERDGKVKTTVQKRVKFTDLKKIVDNNIDVIKSTLLTDDFKGYKPFKKVMPHYSVNHSKGEYSRNGINTNSIESFWAIVKRGMFGQFHWVSKGYLATYLNEFCWKFNNKDNENNFDDLVDNMLFV